jgi:Methyltransferase domain
MRVKAIVGLGLGAVFRFVHIRSRSQYNIVPGYRHRKSPIYFDDTANTDDYQKEVYIYARQVMIDKELSSVCDVGCGSAFKLIEYLGQFETIGFDVPETVEFLRKKYSSRRWEIAKFQEHHPTYPDLIVCADVIEHVADADELVAFIKGKRPRYVILSTPDRDLVYNRGSRYHIGPPRNPAHLREWSFNEFAEYISRSFRIIEHIITNPEQATQMIFCTPV